MAIWTIIILVLYFLPTITAYEKKHENKVPIMLVNVFLGWTFLGWIIALVWAYKK